MDGLPHPELGLPGSDRFDRTVALLDELMAAGVADWARPGTGDALELVLFAYSGHQDRVDELLGLLALPAAPSDGRDIPLPLRLRIGPPDAQGIQVRTRSMFGIVQLASAAVEVPASHVEAGLVAPLPAESPAPAHSLVVKSSEEPPDDATVAVLHDGWWFCIERTDHRSKLMFRVLQRLFDLRVAATQPDAGAPVLTLPVN